MTEAASPTESISEQPTEPGPEPAAAPDPDTPFRGSTSGISRQRLRARRYRRETRDVYVAAEVPAGLVTTCQSLQRALPDAVISLRTAARLLGVPLPRLRRRDRDGTGAELVHLTRDPEAGVSERPGTRTHRATLTDDEVVKVDGVRITGLVRTFLDLAGAGADLEELVCIADVIVRREGRAGLDAAVRAARGRRGVVRARLAASLCDPGAVSPAETRTRLILRGAGFAGLVHGVVVRDELGGWLAEPDLADPEARVAIQYDGAVHFEIDDDGIDEVERRRRLVELRRNDIDRDELCREQGWEVVVLTAIDLRQPWRMIAKVRAAYARAAARAALSTPTGSSRP